MAAEKIPGTAAIIIEEWRSGLKKKLKADS